MKKIDLCCPYCETEFQVETPLPPKKFVGGRFLRYFSGNLSSQKNTQKYLEPIELPVMCLPYTRDIGKFDPGPDDDIYSAERWSRIGKDYLSFINFERFGILRITQKDIDVQYRVQKCAKCGDLFDVFANYTKGKTLGQIWPHLFSRDVSSGGFRSYKGENLIVRFVRSFGELVKSKFVGVFLFSLLIFILGWLPYFVMNQSLSCSDIGALDFRLSGLIRYQLENLQNPNHTFEELSLYNCDSILTISTFVLYAFASFGVMFLLMNFENYLSYLQNSADFDNLFCLKRPEVGVNFWKNYIASRFVGVQRIKDDSDVEKGKTRQTIFHTPQATQSDIFAGGISLSLALVSWVVDQNKSHQFTDAIMSGNLSIALFFIAELIVWLVIIYFLSISIFLSLSLTSYVLNGVRKIPMTVNPYDNFSSSKPLKTLEAYAVNIMLVTFIVILLVLSMSQMILRIEWILAWFKLALAMLFIAVGLGSSRNEYIVGAVLYLLFLGILYYHTPLNIASLNLEVCQGVVYQMSAGGYICPIQDSAGLIPIIDLSVLILGFFLTGALAFQLYSADQYINNLLIKSKFVAIATQKKQLDILQKNLDDLNNKIIKFHGRDNDLNDYQSQRYSILSSIDTTIKIIDHLGKIEIKRNPFSNSAKALAPLVTSLVLAIIQSAAMKSLGLS